ncbi:MAG: Ig-like domain-containing protein [Methanobacterium sp.]|nr:Ig-like domain-containing protein [Methanobacterium sp.]
MVNIANGVYGGENNANITLDKSITINGESREGTILNGSGAFLIFMINTGQSVTIQNLTQNNGYAEAGGSIANNGTLTLIETTFTGNNVRGGSAIANGGNLTIISSSFTNNTAVKLNESVYGSGFIFNVGNLTLNNCYFTNNVGEVGSAIFNYADLSYKGISTIENCIFEYNSADYGGAIVNLGDLTLNNSNFSNNKALTGGAIFNQGNLLIKGTNFNQNSLNGKDFASGGAIYNLANLTVFNSTFDSNSAFMGGAISNDGNTTINSCQFINNIVNSTNSTIPCSGGAIYNSEGTLIVNSSKFTGNTAQSSFSDNLYFGGAISNMGDTLALRNCEFVNNVADSGGAISNSAYLIIKNCNFSGNTAISGTEDIAYDGGAISNYGTSNVYDSIFTDNSADMGGAISNWVDSTFFASGSTFKRNGANANGDVFYNEGKLRVNFCQIMENGMDGYYPEDIYNEGGSADARYNWWGSNQNPSDRVVNADVSSRMVLRLTPGSATINNGGISVLTADLLYDINGVYHDPNKGHVPDGIVVKFTSNLGTIGTTYVTTTNGVARSTLKGGSKAGTADVAASTGSQSIHKSVKIDLIPPKVTYTYPKKSATGVSRTKTIYLKFSENIKTGINWSKIVIKDKYGRTVNISKWISGNTLFLKTSSKRSSNSYYTVYIPSSAISDLAGNGLTPGYVIKFKTGRY